MARIVLTALLAVLAVQIVWFPAFADIRITHDMGGNDEYRLGLTVTMDRGGVIASYRDHYDKLHARGERVVIDGTCASACTLALAYPRTCVTPRAKLGFHSAYYPIINIISQPWTDYMLAHYPKGVQRWINARGGMQREMKWLQGPDMLKLVRTC